MSAGEAAPADFAHSHGRLPEIAVPSYAIPLSAIAACTLALAPAAYAQTGSAGDEVMSVTAGKLRIERLATLEFPWGMALLPDGALLITEKPGRLRIWDDGKLSEPIAGVPDVVYRTPGEQGGLLDVAIDPDFERNRLVYLLCGGRRPAAGERRRDRR
jgi:glucose/arabinose dehydrogenase